MYDAQILPILMYGSELWGFQQFAVTEKAHMFACKRFLNVSVQTPNKMIYGDLGRHPMFITSAVQCVKYWLRITNLPDEMLPKRLITCCCICKIWVKRRGPIMSKNCCVETALEMSGCSKMWDI